MSKPVDSKRTMATVSGEFDVPLPRQQVWWALNDPQVLKHCIRGCDDVSRDEDGRFHAGFSFRFGPVKKRLVAYLDVEETAPPARYDLIATVHTGRMGGANGRAEVVLDNIDGGTRLSYAADIEVDGWLAIMGEQALGVAAGKTMRLFFERFTERLT